MKTTIYCALALLPLLALSAAAQNVKITPVGSRRPVYPALSGKTMEFDGDGKCVTGC